MTKKQVEDEFDLFFGNGYIEQQFKKYAVAFTLSCLNKIQLPKDVDSNKLSSRIKRDKLTPDSSSKNKLKKDKLK